MHQRKKNEKKEKKKAQLEEDRTQLSALTFICIKCCIGDPNADDFERCFFLSNYTYMGLFDARKTFPLPF